MTRRTATRIVLFPYFSVYTAALIPPSLRILIPPNFNGVLFSRVPIVRPILKHDQPTDLARTDQLWPEPDIVKALDPTIVEHELHDERTQDAMLRSGACSAHLRQNSGKRSGQRNVAALFGRHDGLP